MYLCVCVCGYLLALTVLLLILFRAQLKISRGEHHSFTSKRLFSHVHIPEDGSSFINGCMLIPVKLTVLTMVDWLSMPVP